VNTSGPSPSLENIAATFRSTLYDMTIQPGSVEDALRPIIAMLNTCSEDTAVNTIVEILFEQVHCTYLLTIVEILFEQVHCTYLLTIVEILFEQVHCTYLLTIVEILFEQVLTNSGVVEQFYFLDLYKHLKGLQQYHKVKKVH
jgi:hypothetical protein